MTSSLRRPCVLRWLLLAAALLFCVSSVQAETIDRVSAIVGDDVITFQDFREEIPFFLLTQGQTPDRLNQLDQAIDRDEAVGLLLEKMVEIRLLEQHANRIKAPITDEDVLRQIRVKGGGSIDPVKQQIESMGLSFEVYKKFLLRQLKAEFVMRSEIDRQISVKPLDAEQCAYEKHPGGEFQDRYTLREIRILLPPANPNLAAASKVGEALYAKYFDAAATARYSMAAILHTQVAGLGEDFEMLARVYSVYLRDSGGLHAESYAKGQMSDVFDPVFSLKEGQISDIIESPAGYHIIKVEKVEKAGNPDWQASIVRCQRQLQQEERLKILEGWLADERAKRFVKVLVNSELAAK